VHVRAGFSLVELLVVIGIIGLLVGLTLPALQSFREAARRTQCSTNLHAMGAALTAYESARRCFPPGDDAFSGRGHAWSSFILPYLDGETLAKRINYAEPWNAPGSNAEVADLVLSTYVCPSGIRMFPGKQDYGGVLGSAVVLAENDPLPPDWEHSGVLYATDAKHRSGVKAAQITDGLTNTLVVSEGVDRGFAAMDNESPIGNARWACGTNCFLLSSRVINTPDVDGFNSHHRGGVQGLYADGRVSFMVDGTEPTVLMAICTKAGRESVGQTP
jgi:prepilin-type N-terminal cleavage/methylation domain-containing protein